MSLVRLSSYGSSPALQLDRHRRMTSRTVNIEGSEGCGREIERDNERTEDELDLVQLVDYLLLDRFGLIPWRRGRLAGTRSLGIEGGESPDVQPWSRKRSTRAEVEVVIGQFRCSASKIIAHPPFHFVFGFESRSLCIRKGSTCSFESITGKSLCQFGWLRGACAVDWCTRHPA